MFSVALLFSPSQSVVFSLDLGSFFPFSNGKQPHATPAVEQNGLVTSHARTNDVVPCVRCCEVQEWRNQEGGIAYRDAKAEIKIHISKANPCTPSCSFVKPLLTRRFKLWHHRKLFLPLGSSILAPHNT